MVVQIHDLLKARVARMADEQIAMQEVLPRVSPECMRWFMSEMDRHAEALSRLATRLIEEDR